MIGSTAAESAILLDEHRFRLEVGAYVKAGGEAAKYGRPRAWPNRGKSLSGDSRYLQSIW
jgi:hypothetical protein